MKAITEFGWRITNPSVQHNILNLPLFNWNPRLAPVIVRQAYDRGIDFSSLVCDGDYKTIEALKDA